MLVKPSEEAMTAALVRELCSGRQFMESMQKYREADAAQIAAESRKNMPKKGGLRHIAEIPQHEYLRIAQHYGHECWEDREFVRDFQKFEPTMAVHKI